MQLRTLIAVFTFTFVDSSGSISWVCEDDGPSSGCLDAQTDLDLLFSHIVEHHF